MKTPSRKLNILSLMGFLLFSLTGFAPIESFPAQDATPQPEGPTVRITQVDTSQFPSVTVYVSVTNAAGEPVQVSPSQLVLQENGVEVTPEDIQATGDIGPLTTMLVIDISGSMNHAGKLEAAKAAARAYIDQSRPKDVTGVLTFNTQVEYLQPLTSDRQALITAIEGLEAQEDTAMYDTLARAIELLQAVTGRKAVIVMTDGLDNRSKVSPQEVIRMIGPEGLSISVIGLGEPDQSTSALSSLDEAALSALAEEAGGVYGYANNAESLRGLYERYGRALQSEYAITYTSSFKLRDGVNRALSVSLKNSTGGGSATTSENYNPGGLVPEVAEPASWGVYIAIAAALLALLAVPKLIGLVGSAVGKKPKGKVKLVGKAPTKRNQRIKLKN